MKRGNTKKRLLNWFALESLSMRQVFAVVCGGISEIFSGFFFESGFCGDALRNLLFDGKQTLKEGRESNERVCS